MLDNVMKSMKRGNALSLLYQEIMEAKTKKEKEILYRRSQLNYEFAGQHTSKVRQQKLAYMKQFDLKTGKQFRRHIKAMRRTSRGGLRNEA
jgi:hypothetical protein